jgi:uncharacterized protein (DUF2062 family)
MTRRNLHSLIRQVLHLRESPQRTALAFALGVFIAFCPAYGFHTAMVVLSTWLFELNFVALMAGAFINNPWTLVPILGVTYWTGAALMGRTDAPAFEWHDLSMTGLYQQIIPYAVPFVVGGVVLSVAGAALTYPAAYYFLSKHRRRTHSEEPLPPSDVVG